MNLLERNGVKRKALTKVLNQKSLLLLMLIIWYLVTMTDVFPFSSSIPNVFAQEEFPTDRPLVYVDPPLTEKDKGQSFTVGVKIFNLTDAYVKDPEDPKLMRPLGNLWGFDIRFAWDPAILKYESHLPKVGVETYPDGVLYEPVMGIKNEVNSALGTYTIAYVSTSPAEAFNNPYESNTVFEMTFKVIKSGACDLKLTSIKLATNIIGEAILYHSQDGSFQTPGAPTAKFSIWPADGYAAVNKPVMFNASESTASSPKYVMLYIWDFGDNTRVNCTVPTVDHTYAAKGLYKVTLKVMDDEGMVSAPEEKPVYVVEKRDIAIKALWLSSEVVVWGEKVMINVTVGNKGEAPESFTISTYYNVTPTDGWALIQQKQMLDLKPGSDGVVSFNWDTSTLPKETARYYILANTTNVPHEEQTNDNYKRSLTPVWIVIGNRPKAQFTYSPATPETNEEVEFNASASFDPDGYIISYYWDFSDGFTVIETNPIVKHVFLYSGSYMVTLTVTDNDGLVSSVQKLVLVHTLPKVYFKWEPQKPRVYETVTFEVSAYDLDGWIVSYYCDFGDGTAFTAPYLYLTSHTYTETGTYTVTITVVDNEGFSGMAQAQITILPRLVLSLNPEKGIVGTIVTVTGSKATSDGALNVYWGTRMYYGGYWIYTLIKTTNADANGDFTFTIEVPPSTMGTHLVKVEDLTTLTYEEKLFEVLPHISIDPTSGAVGTKVTIRGTGFPFTQGLVFTYIMFDDQILFAVTMPDENGNTQATISVPLASPGPHAIKVLSSYYYSPYYIAEATFTIVDTTPLDVTADVGAFYFKGEVAQFYVQTAFKGTAVNITSLNAKLYKPDGTTQSLSSQQISTGLYKVTYAIKGKGSMQGTYTLVIEAGYEDNTINAYGTSIKTFLVKPTWEREAPKIAAFSIASIGLTSAMILLWKKEKKKFL